MYLLNPDLNTDIKCCQPCALLAGPLFTKNIALARFSTNKMETKKETLILCRKQFNALA